MMIETTINNRPCLVPDGDLVTDRVEALHEAIGRILGQGFGEIIIDCRHVNNVYSRGLAMLLKTHKRMRDKGQPGLALVNLHPRLSQLLSLINLQKIIPCFTTAGEYQLQTDLYRPEPEPEDGQPVFHFTATERESILWVKAEGMLSAVCNLKPFKDEIRKRLGTSSGVVVDLH
jgi:anti-anti-sigma factor